jgi:ABC-type polar amino acid transport system ATPase subunit
MIIVDNLTVAIAQKNVLKQVSLKLNPGRISVFIGGSGAGKTTLLKAIAGLTKETDGNITVDNVTLNSLNPYERAEKIGYVFQEFNLFAHFTALENCIDPLMVHGASYESATGQALQLLHNLDIEQYGDHYPAELSGGQQQRIAIARALSLRPKVILLDEPSASLDPANTDRLVEILKSLAYQGLTVVLSSQDMSFVRKVADCIYFIEDGRVAQECDDVAKIEQCSLINRWINQ